VTSADRRLVAVKVLHTVVWAFFAGCVVGILVAAWQDRLALAVALIGVVMLEVLVLVFNGWRCPLTGVAARYTEDREHNFDIYLPVWLARWNKEIFGTLFVLGMLLTAIRWFGAPA
jgi:hypothetical protein